MPFIHNNGGAILEGRGYNGDPFYTPITPQEAERFKTLYARYIDALKALKNKHQGETIHVFGTGPSLNDYAAKFDWSEEITIGVNGAPAIINNLTYWLTFDDFINPAVPSDLYKWILNWVKTPTETVKLIRRGIVKHPGAWLPNIMFHNASGPASEPHMGLFCANSSVQTAIDLARHMGAKKICLWGTDYHDASHAYAITDNTPKAKSFEKVQSQFKVVGDACKGIEIVNCNPNSRLKCFPFESPELALPRISDHYIVLSLDYEFVEYRVDNEVFVVPFDQLKSKESQKSIKKLAALIQEQIHGK